MRATDELRKMLDEADEYYKTSGNKTWWGRPIDMQTGKPINVFHYQAQPMGEDRLFVELQLATPAQAIAATLGSSNCTNDERTNDTCHVRATTRLGDSWFGFKLSCGHSMVNPFNDRPDYCPWCGAKVVEG